MFKNIIKKMLSDKVRSYLRDLQKNIVYMYRCYKIRIPVFFGRNIKIILGAALTRQHGWYSTNEQWLDITNCSDWERIFKGKVILDNVVSEHVFEHLTPKETKQALRLIYKHMRSGGRVRIAVPDGFNPNEVYLKHVGICGIGADAEDHKQLLNSSSLIGYLEEAGFKATLVEGYDEDGKLIQTKVEAEFGYIYRSRSNLKAMKYQEGWDFVDSNTSLIVDGVK